MRIPVTIFEPPDHPLIDGFSTFEGHAVRTRSDREAHVVFSVVNRGPAPSLLIDSARATHGSNACRLHFRPAEQVVQGPFGIPNKIASHTLANQNTLGSRLDMLGDRLARQGSADLPVIGLFSFALSYRIESETHEALQREIGGESLRLRLPLLGMTGLQKDSRVTTGLVGPVK